ncbi:hypothetical protein [Litorilituus lipolyticus]|uniref:Uncharacterized protein n=1 Tax=Litorilituus lipolyticus TaxID=2491017 RepID=A0A502KSX8_9GAMM|nr:hypothetical protein [Litorilituus lipolyticus]TPH13265.1 hypothetical protein EPA86_13810 [Litorilituus lipolyticus]
MSEQIDSLNCLKRMAGSCIINKDDEYEYHLQECINAMSKNLHNDYPYMNWFAAVGVYEVENGLPLLSNQMYDEMVDSYE